MASSCARTKTRAGSQPTNHKATETGADTPLDKQAELWLKGLAESGLPPFNEMTVPDARAAYHSIVAEHGIAAEPVADITERTIPGPGGKIPVRIYTPSGSKPLPVLVYFHGGGGGLGNFDSVHRPC